MRPSANLPAVSNSSLGPPCSCTTVLNLIWVFPLPLPSCLADPPLAYCYFALTVFLCHCASFSQLNVVHSSVVSTAQAGDRYDLRVRMVKLFLCTLVGVFAWYKPMTQHGFVYASSKCCSICVFLHWMSLQGCLWLYYNMPDWPPKWFLLLVF